LVIRFWGVRGSLPAPLLPSQVQEKIAFVVRHIQAHDIESTASRERFLSELPLWIFGTVGGNTTCLSVSFDDDPANLLIFDAGSGIRELGLSESQRGKTARHYHIFFSHFHWDHIMGLPFFLPAYNPASSLDFYSPKPQLKAILSKQMEIPYFPATMDSFTHQILFHHITGSVSLCGSTIYYRKMYHPGDSYSYVVDDGQHRFLFATDVELRDADFCINEENKAFFQNIDLAVIDSQYTLEEFIEKFDWGHGAFSSAVDFAAHWGMKHLILFHHEPVYHDKKLYAILKASEDHIKSHKKAGLRVTLATEELEISI
jgi:phosphoribosyl 1,2-cyclic phosphodiesterase